MAGSKEKRERIKWYAARNVFFARRFGEGLALAKTSEFDDARYLVCLSSPTTQSPRTWPLQFSSLETTTRDAFAGLQS